MAKLGIIHIGLLVILLGVYGAAQDSSQPGTTPAPAFGQSAPVLSPDNPPLSGLDEPGLELKRASRSFISPAIQIGEAADTNENNQLGINNVQPVSHVLGALDLQKFWSKDDLFLEYLGGGAFQTKPKYNAQQLQAFGMEAITRWRTGYLELRDAFQYVPDGAFDTGGLAGGTPGLGIAYGLGTGEAEGGVPGIMRFNSLNDVVADIPRLANVAVADVVQAISPRSAFTVVGAFGDSHFFDNSCSQPATAPGCLINGDQTTVEGGYSHLISRRDQIAGVYAYQLFRFPYNTGGEIYNQVFNLRWSHTITGRLRLIIGLGPQYTDLQYGVASPQWSLSGRASLRYQFAHSSLVASWEKFTSAGSGYFAGADTQVARLAYRRPLGRTFVVTTDLDYSHSQRLQAPIGTDYTFNNFDAGSAGIVVRKHIGRTYDVFATYRFSEVGLNAPVSTANCASTLGCGTIAQRHQGAVGLEWHPRPTRIE